MKSHLRSRTFHKIQREVFKFLFTRCELLSLLLTHFFSFRRGVNLSFDIAREATERACATITQSNFGAG